MQPYISNPLTDPREFRIVNLLPGIPGDEIWIEILNVRLDQPKPTPQIRMTLRDLEKTLPADWKAYETHEGKYTFIHDSESRPTWHHPDPIMNPSLYSLLPEDDNVDIVPSYEALSYTWGSQLDQQEIFVRQGGDHTPYTVSVGKNLALALEHLRYTDESRALWIDSLCINQSDDIEKSHQVNRMAIFYSLARRVVIWLGPEHKNSKLGLKTVDYLGNQVETTTSGRYFMSNGATEPDWWNSLINLPYDEETWEAVTDLLDRAWFTRLWVVQEVSLASRFTVMRCGNDEIPWPNFRRAVICLRYKKYLPSQKLRSLTFLINPMVLNSQSYSFGDLLWMLGGYRQCEDARDKVYGMLGIAPIGLAKLITPNYSLKPADVYKDTFLSHLKLTCRWEIFTSPWETSSLLSLAPSWVPDFGSPQSTGRIPSRQFCAGHSGIEFTYHSPNILEVAGLQCATVVSVKAGVSLNGGGEALHQAVQSWVPKDINTAAYPTGEKLMDVFAITLRQNNLNPRFLRESEPPLEEWRSYIYEVVLAGKEDGSVKFDFSTFFATELLRSCYGRHFMSTREGFIGLGPSGVSSGDIICVFLGCDRPVVLRPQSDGLFRFIGDCFVYGLNDTAAFLGPLPKPWIVQIKFHPHNSERFLHYFLNRETGQATPEDPRLEPHPDWERVHEEELGRELTGDDPELSDYFINRRSGEMRNSDPRLTSEALQARGVELQKFKIS